MPANTTVDPLPEFVAVKVPSAEAIQDLAHNGRDVPAPEPVNVRVYPPVPISRVWVVAIFICVALAEDNRVIVGVLDPPEMETIPMSWPDVLSVQFLVPVGDQVRVPVPFV